MGWGARERGLVCGTLPPGRLNAITDVPGVRVGHRTLREGEINTGVTAIVPHDGNLYRRGVLAASHVINGFGKSVGLVQIDELGVLETPVLLTNTFSVAACAEALIREAVEANPDIGRTTATVNPVVCECNDGLLSDIQAMAVTEAHAKEALRAARAGAVEEGSVGAGTGMVCFGFKGGIGSASRQLLLGGQTRHLGIIALTNFGRPGDLVLPGGARVPHPDHDRATGDATEKGSVIVVMATDIALDYRQLLRVTRRCGAGLARLGAFWGHGSGDIALGFSTAVEFDHDETRDFVPTQRLNEARIDLLFQAAAEATTEAVLNALFAATAFEGRAGHARPALGALLDAQDRHA